MDVRQNYLNIQNNIKKASQKVGRDSAEINVIAVTKYVSTDRAKAAIDAGIKHLGENRVEGILGKQSEIQGNGVTWHFIGTLQSRKVKDVINTIDVLHSLDRLSVAKEIEKRSDTVKDCFVQVNISGEESKHGLGENELFKFIEELSGFKKIRVIGLMTMAPYTEDEELIRNIFRRLKKCQEKIQEQKYAHAPCTELSMGMSNDYQIAIEEGATFIRIGTALVGKER